MGNFSFCISERMRVPYCDIRNYSLSLLVLSIHSYLRAIERFVARLELLQPLLWVLLFHHRITSPFSDTPLTVLATALPSSQCPCRMIWFEEILKGSYKVVLCPRSGEGYFGLARRTYSLQCPPDIAAVSLNRFTFRQCDEATPQEAAELFSAAQQNAQWRYRSYLRMLSTNWSNEE